MVFVGKYRERIDIGLPGEKPGFQVDAPVVADSPRRFQRSDSPVALPIVAVQRQKFCTGEVIRAKPDAKDQIIIRHADALQLSFAVTTVILILENQPEIHRGISDLGERAFEAAGRREIALLVIAG